MKRIILSAVLACLVAGLAAPADALDLQRRRMLTAKEHVPWRAVGRVNVATTFESGMCTGTLIAEDLVLTAAHCVVSARTGIAYKPSDVHFVAGWRMGQKVAHSKAKEIAVHPGYRRIDYAQPEQIATDLALIRLENSVPMAKAPFFDIGAAPGAESALTLISYRQDRAHALTRQDGCGVIEIEGAVMSLGCNVTFGASGSPLFAQVEGATRLVAVVSAKGNDPRQPTAYAVLVDTAIAAVLAVLD